MAGASSKVPRPATYADIEALPEHLTGEIIAGELVVSPRPAPPHILAASRLGSLLGGPFDEGFDGPGGWWILDEPELQLGGDVLVPDLAGWRVERMPELPEAAAFELAPDWVCEVLSPRTERHDRVEKLDVYAREAVRHVWLLNPVLRLLEVLRLEGGRWLLIATHGKEEEPLRIEPFDAVPIDLRRLWTRKTGE
jgi:Uma2 family endonuclease